MRLILLLVLANVIACSSVPRDHRSYQPIELGYPQFVQLDWPVDRAKLTQKFKNYRGKKHFGIDLAARKNTPIFSAEQGKVIYAGSGFSGYGQMLIIEHNNNWATLYSHFSQIKVRQGDWVVKGQRIGLMGKTGNATGVHLHFEVRRNKKPVNPLEFLPQSRRLAKNQF